MKKNNVKLLSLVKDQDNHGHGSGARWCLQTEEKKSCT